MPKIDAATVAEHREMQTQRVLDVAAELFLERGYHDVSIGDIADAMGLRRSSLYRYVPDKQGLAVQLLERELARQLVQDRAAVAASASLPPTERVERWALRQLEFARDPAHRLVVELTEAIAAGRRSEQTLAAAHVDLLRPLEDALAETEGLVDRGMTAELIAGLVVATARAEQRPGADVDVARAAMRRGIHALLDG